MPVKSFSPGICPVKPAPQRRATQRKTGESAAKARYGETPASQTALGPAPSAPQGRVRLRPGAIRQGKLVNRGLFVPNEALHRNAAQGQRGIKFGDFVERRLGHFGGNVADNVTDFTGGAQDLTFDVHPGI